MRDWSHAGFAIGDTVAWRRHAVGEAGLEPRPCPSEPTVHTLNDALSAQFATSRSVAVKTCDYGSGGRGFESLPARKRPATTL
jgi:hypothetical protein